jgi:hypothetical protein
MNCIHKPKSECTMEHENGYLTWISKAQVAALEQGGSMPVVLRLHKHAMVSI